MTLSIGAAVSDGLSLAASRNGAVLAGVFLAAETLGLLLFLAAGTMYVPVDFGTGLASGSGVPVGELPEVASGVAIVLTGLFNSIVFVPISVVAIRTFVGGATDEFPDAYLFRRLGRATLSGVVATFAHSALLFGIPMGAGLLAVVVLVATSGPLAIIGVVVLVCLAIGGVVLAWLQFLFLLHEIGVRDRGVVDAFRGSWATVRGSRPKLALLAGGLAIVRMTISGAGAPTPQDSLTADQLALTSVSLVASAVVGVVVVAIMARAYRQLRPDVDEPPRNDNAATAHASHQSSA